MPPSIPPRSLARSIISDLPVRLPFHQAARPSPSGPPPTLTLRSAASRLFPRINPTATTVPGGYGNARNGPDAGTVVGIVLGSVAGFLLLLWLIYSCVNLGNPNKTVETGSEGGGTASVVTRKSRKHKRRSHHSPRRETVEIRTERIVPPQPPPPERIIIEERTTSRARPGPPPMPMPMPIPRPMPPPPPPPPMSDDDEVVVIEEHSPPRRRESRHKRSSERRSRGYREVDPHQYAGGEASMRDMSRRRSGSRRR